MMCPKPLRIKTKIDVTSRLKRESRRHRKGCGIRSVKWRSEIASLCPAPTRKKERWRTGMRSSSSRLRGLGAFTLREVEGGVRVWMDRMTAKGEYVCTECGRNITVGDPGVHIVAYEKDGDLSQPLCERLSVPSAL